MAIPSSWLSQGDMSGNRIDGLRAAFEPMTATAEFYGELPRVIETVWPKHRFTVYEPSDEAWALPVGYAKRVTRPLRLGDAVQITVGKDKMDCHVKDIRLEDKAGHLLCWQVDCRISGYKFAAGERTG